MEKLTYMIDLYMITIVASFDNILFVDFTRILISPDIAHGEDLISFGGGEGRLLETFPLVSFSIHDCTPPSHRPHTHKYPFRIKSLR